MSKLLILAGIPAKTIAKEAEFIFEGRYEGWDCRRIDSNSREVDLAFCWENVLEVIFEHQRAGGADDGVHVLAFHKETKETESRKSYASQINPYHRIVFPSTKMLHGFGNEAFCAALDAYVEFEERWRAAVLPTMPSAPLILPETRFAAPGRFKDIWSNAKTVVDDLDQLEILRKTVEQFRNVLHAEKPPRNGQARIGYKDERKLIFIYTGARHGECFDNPAQSWKFNYRIPNRFHYDVEPLDGNDPMYFVHDGRERRFVDHVNIYPHGFLRP